MNSSELSQYFSFLRDEADSLIQQRGMDLEQLQRFFVEFDHFKERLSESEELDADSKELAQSIELNVNRSRHTSKGFGMRVRRRIPFGSLLIPVDFRQTKGELEDFRNKASHFAFMFQ